MRSKLLLHSLSVPNWHRLHGGHGSLCSNHSARNPGLGYGTKNYDSFAPEYELENTLV